MKYHEITVLFHAIENALANHSRCDILGVHDGMVGWLDVTHIVEFTTVFLYRVF